MKKLVLSLALALAVTGASYAQEEENFSNHQVAMGETVLVIAKKYKITPRDIYDYNPDAIEGVGQNANLRIPLHRQLKPKPVYVEEAYVYEAPTADSKDVSVKQVPAETVAVAETVAPVATAPAVYEPTPMQTMKHTVQDGETLTSLARKYNTTIKAIEKENPGKLKSGLQTGETLSITTIPRLGDPSQYVSHDVNSGETLIGLARKYNTTVDAITESNRITLKKGLQTGQQLMILPGLSTASPEINRGVLANANAVEHTVKNGETLMTLAQKYNTTVEDITANNQSKLGSGIQAGQVLTIKNNATAISTVAE